MASRSSNSNLNVQITGDQRSLSKATRDAGGALDKLGKQTMMTARVTQRGFSSIGVAARGAAAASVAAAAGFAALGKKAISTASDINESLTKNQVLFGKHADAIDEWSKQTATSMGISRTAALEATGTFGNLFTALEIGPKKSADMSTALVKLAADMASFNNASPEDALEAIRSGLVGETEPLRKFGVNMNDATLRAEALSMGLVKSTKESLDPQTRALAANALIMKQTASAHGDFARTSGGLANQTRILKARLSDLAGTLGTALLPAAQGATKWINKLLDDIKSGKGVVGGFANALADMPGKLADEFNKIKDDPRGPGAAIGAMIVDGIDSIDWGALGEKVSQGFNSALKIGGKVGSAIVDAFQQVPWDQVGDAIGKGVEGSLNFADKLPSMISAGISKAVEQVNGRQVLGKLVDIIGQAIDALFSPSFWAEHWKGVLATVTLAIPVAKLLKIPGAATLFKFISKPVFEAIGFLGKGMLSLLGKAASEAGVSFLAQLEHVLPRTANLLLRLVTGAGKALASLPGKLAGIASDAADAVARKLGSATGTIVGKMTGWVVSGVKAVGRLVGRVAQEGTVIGRSILSGILAGLGTLGHVLLQKIQDAVGWVKDRVGGIASGIGKKLNPFGDGVGRPSLPSVANFGGGLMGARPSMAPFAAAGSRFGLRVSSGRRPGAITSSGNVSYHSSGEAIDMAGGPAGMLGFFRQMKAKFGSRLAELIYTPGGQGVKDGHPYTYGGQVARDHFDHVHVAYDTGVPGVGDGLGKFTASAYGPPWGGIQGTGVTTTGVNLKGSPHTYGVAVDPRVIPLGSKLKIKPNPFGYSGSFTAFDTGGAIKGKRIDFYDWRGRKAQLGWGMRSVSVSTVTGSGGSSGGSGTGGKGGGKPKLPAHGHAGGGPMVNERPGAPGYEVPSEYEQHAGMYGAGRGPLKGNLTIKGRPMLDVPEGPEGPTPTDYLNAAIAEAALTPGSEDDLAALNQLKAYDVQQLAAARASGDPRKIAEAATNLKSAQDSIDSLTDAINQANEIQRQRDQLDQQIAANQLKILALANQGPQILAAVIAAVNGGIGGQVGLGLQTPGYAGQVARY